MIKRLDWYIIRTFFGPFLFIFSVLMFIFVFQFAFTQMDKFIGKGLTLWDITKLLYYLGLDVVRLVLPLTILLSSIMTFGGFGERYELVAIKASGISLARTMYPLFGFVFLMSLWLVYFCNTVLPGNQRKARNMLINIVKTRPALNFEEGRFITELKPYSIKIGKKGGKDGNEWEDVFIHKNAASNDDQQTITADKGSILGKDNNYLKLELYNGYIYQNNVKGKNRREIRRQPSTNIKFDTLTQYLDVSELVKKSLDKESGGDYFKYKSFRELTPYIDSVKKANIQFYKATGEAGLNNLLGNTNFKDTLNFSRNEESYLWDFNSLSNEKKYSRIKTAITQVRFAKKDWETRSSELTGVEKYMARMILWQHRNILSYAVTCLVFFLIGAPLGAIIRKGGIGMPVVVAIIIFIIFYVAGLYLENMAKDQKINPYWASWIPNIVLFPLGIYLTRKSMQDSDIFDINKYLDPFRKLFNIFKKNTEHKRYQ